MSRLIAPIANFATATINNTLHGRTVYRSEDVPAHNVFKGWSTWLTNGHRGVGDGLDIGGQGWRTPVVAVCDGVQSYFANDMTKLEVLYLEGDGIVAVYAHVNAVFEGTGKRWRQGETIGVLRGDLNWAHLHWELWVDGAVIAAQTPEALRAKMLGLFAQAPAPDDDLQVVLIREPGQPGEIVACRPAFENNITRGDVAVLAAAFGYKASYDPDNANGPRVYLNKEA